MKTLLLTLLLLLPLGASAHATPVEYVPESSSVLTTPPTEVSIRFSERLEEGASRIQVTNEEGVEITTEDAVVGENPYILTVPVKASGEGAYFVSWSVVSSDDGHFTKGGYAYVVGSGIPVPSVNSTAFEVVQISAIPEAALIFVELLGNSILWGVIILFAFAFRRFREHPMVRRGYLVLISVGVLAIVGGGGGHILLKTSELAALHQISFTEALSLYFATVSGSATVLRMLMGIGVGVFFAIRRNAILNSPALTVSEWAMLLLLLIFAYYRAIVSHATANPFFPELSVWMNVLHLVGKDLWEGVIGILSVGYLFRDIRPMLHEVFAPAFRLAALSFGLAGVTGAYIIWLHLRDFENVSSTLWGERFLPLLASLMAAIALLAYHVLAHRYRPRWFSRFLPYSLPAETAAGVLVIFFSSLMIITSPPLHSGTVTMQQENKGLTIALSGAPFEDDMVLLETEEAQIVPTVWLDAGAEGEGARIQLERRFEGGYVFPVALITDAAHTISVVQPQTGGYDARVAFEVTKNDFLHTDGRVVDLFTVIMSLLAVLSVIAALILVRLSRGPYPPQTERGSLLRYGIGFVVALLVLSQIVGLLQLLFGNSYKKECVADGNGWHVMLPARNTIPVSSTAVEGCMALGGSFHIADAREYRYLKSQSGSTVEFAHPLTTITAGVPFTFDFEIMDRDGKPAILSVAHDRLAHMLIVSEDMKDFFHVHPEDESRSPHFTRTFTFPRAGTYILALDYAHGLKQESRTFTFDVAGAPGMADAPDTYPSEGTFDGYEVSIRYAIPVVGSYSTLTYRVMKEGEDVTDLAPYLSAAMHVAVVKNDLSEFVHTHGEVHPLGAPVTQVSSTTVHMHTPPPPAFGPVIEAHVLFTSPGLYTLFGEFVHLGKVVTSRFTVRVE